MTKQNKPIFICFAISMFMYAFNVSKDQSYTGRCRGCNVQCTSNNLASQYQRQKIIQNTVRIPSSLYTMNVASFNAVQQPLSIYQQVIQPQTGVPILIPPKTQWNTMSDRFAPAKQSVVTVTRNRPGSMSPGGAGVDIKHGSYDRYLLRKKGKAPLRSQPPIVAGCGCSSPTDIYSDPMNAIQDEIFNVTYTFHVGDAVWAAKNDEIPTVYKATIVEINGNMYTLLFENQDTRITPVGNILPYFSV